MVNDKVKTRIIESNKIVGFVDYGSTDSLWATKMRCKCCGGAWLAEEYILGSDVCPKCGAEGKNVIFAPKI